MDDTQAVSTSCFCQLGDDGAVPFMGIVLQAEKACAELGGDRDEFVECGGLGVEADAELGEVFG